MHRGHGAAAGRRPPDASLCSTTPRSWARSCSERLGPSLFELALPVARRHEILCDTAARVWRPAPGAPLPTGADRAQRLAAFSHRGTWGEAGSTVHRARRRPRRGVRCVGGRRPTTANGPSSSTATCTSSTPCGRERSSSSGRSRRAPGRARVRPRDRECGAIRWSCSGATRRSGPRRSPPTLASEAAAIWEWGVLERVGERVALCRDRPPAARQRDAGRGRCGRRPRPRVTAPPDLGPGRSVFGQVPQQLGDPEGEVEGLAGVEPGVTGRRVALVRGRPRGSPRPRPGTR